MRHQPFHHFDKSRHSTLFITSFNVGILTQQSVKFVTLDADNAVEWNLASGSLPALAKNIEGANAETLVAEFPYFEPFMEILEYGQPEGQFPDRDFVWYEVAYPEGVNFLQGNATAEETLQNMESAVQGSFE